MKMIIVKRGVRSVLAAAALTIASVATLPASAHHSTAGYDYTKTITLRGTVSQFQWTNPHMFIKLRVPQNGREVEWNVEAGTPNINARNGWRRTDIKIGDRVVVQASPMRDGTSAATLISIRLPDGRILWGPAVDVRGAPQR